MKAFKNWYIENCDPAYYSPQVIEQMKRAWKAALEWALKQYLNNPHLDIIDIVDWIRKELEESE